MDIERRRDNLGLEDVSPTNDVHSISLCAVAPNDKLRARKSTGLILRVVVVQVLAAQEEDPAVVEFDEIVRSFVLELLDLERSLRSISFPTKADLVLRAYEYDLLCFRLPFR